VLSEEALLVVIGLVACGMIVLGTLELAWPAQATRGRRYDPRRSPRRRMRRGRAHAHAGGRGYTLSRRAAAARPEGTLARAVAAVPSVTASRAPSPLSPALAAVVASLPDIRDDVVSPESMAPAEAPAAEPMPAEALPAEPIAPQPSPRDEDALDAIAVESMTADPSAADASALTEPAADACVERCFALYQQRRYADVVVLGEPALAADPAAARRAGRPRDVAALWSVVGLAKAALEDPDGAAFALEAAIEVAPEEERAPYEHHFLTVVRDEVYRLLESAEEASGQPEERLRALRDAVAWLRRGRAVADDSVEMEEILETTLAALWPAYEQTVVTLTRHHEFHRARRLLREALADAACPPASAETFRALLSSTFSGEIGKLTAQAIRNMDKSRETEAFAALQRAEGLLGAIPSASLPARRRQEVDRRLWWGYTKLGIAHLEHGRVDAAVEPLFRALAFDDVSAEQRAETRAAVVRALEALAERRVVAGFTGGGEMATIETEMSELLRRARDLGVPGDDLAGAVARVRGLIEVLPARDP